MPRFTQTMYGFSIVLYTLKRRKSDFGRWRLEQMRTSDGWEENTEEHQEAVSATHDCDCERYYDIYESERFERLWAVVLKRSC